MGETTDHSTKLATLNSVTIKVTEASIFEFKYTIKKGERPEIWKILIAYSGIFFKNREKDKGYKIYEISTCFYLLLRFRGGLKIYII